MVEHNKKDPQTLSRPNNGITEALIRLQKLASVWIGCNGLLKFCVFLFRNLIMIVNYHDPHR